PPTPPIHTFSLHDALPISSRSAFQAKPTMPPGPASPSTRENTVPPVSKLKMPEGCSVFLRTSRSIESSTHGTLRTQQITLAFGKDRKSTRLNSSHDQISYA